MKNIILVFLLISSANSFKIKISDISGRVAKNICALYPSGTTFPVAYDCNQFVVCVGGHITIAKCPPSAMYFDPCTLMCSASSYVCSKTYCDWPEEPEEPEGPPENEEPTEGPNGLGLRDRFRMKTVV